LRIPFLCPHLRIAGGVRAILTYADRLAALGHAVTVVVPARGVVRALRRRLAGAGPAWMPGFRARVRWVARWDADALPDGDALVATAWQSAPVAAAAPARCGAGFYLVQHYESLYHGVPDTVDATYRLPLRKLVISTWLRDVMRERFGSDAEVLVTPVDLELFRPGPLAVQSPRPRVLMLHHEYPWKGVASVPHAAAFSAWGGACMDYAHRRHKSVSGMIPPIEDPTMKLMAAQTVSAAWEELEQQLLA